MTPGRFLREFVSIGRPVLVRGALNMSLPFWQRLRAPGFNSSFGTRDVEVGGVPYSKQFNRPGLSMHLEDYLQYMASGS